MNSPTLHHITIVLCTLCFFRATAQPQSKTLKTIRTLDNTFTLTEQVEVQGGWLHINGNPWEVVDTMLVQNNLLVYDESAKKCYRFLPLEESTDQTPAFQNENNWERVHLVTNFDKNESYNKGDIVVSDLNNGKTGAEKIIYGYRFFQALHDMEAATSETPFNRGEIPAPNSSMWWILGQRTYFETVEEKGVASKATGGYLREREIVVSLNQENYSGIAHFELPDVAKAKGQTYTFWNRRTSTTEIPSDANAYIPSPNEVILKGNIEGKAGTELHLFKEGDFVTLVSDGNTWYEIGGNRMPNFVQYRADRLPQDSKKKLDGIYFTTTIEDDDDDPENDEKQMRLISCEGKAANGDKYIGIQIQFRCQYLGPNQWGWKNFYTNLSDGIWNFKLIENTP